MGQKIEKIKTHFHENKKTYLVGIGVAGITVIIMRGRHAEVPRVSDGLETVTVRPLSFLSNQNNHIVTVIEREGRGHPGYMVRCIETDIGYMSQGETARQMDISPSILSSHLNGKIDNAGGYHFERIHMAA